MKALDSSTATPTTQQQQQHQQQQQWQNTTHLPVVDEDLEALAGLSGSGVAPAQPRLAEARHNGVAIERAELAALRAAIAKSGLEARDIGRAICRAVARRARHRKRRGHRRAADLSDPRKHCRRGVDFAVVVGQLEVGAGQAAAPAALGAACVHATRVPAVPPVPAANLVPSEVLGLVTEIGAPLCAALKT